MRMSPEQRLGAVTHTQDRNFLRIGMLEEIENENEHDDEKDCSRQ